MTANFLVVMPWMLPDYTAAAIRSHRLAEAGRVMYVDNSSVNKGIMRSHNMAIDDIKPDEWLITLSAALVFGTPGGLDFIDLLTEHADHGVISAKDTFGWHMIAFRPDVVAAMGRYDEWFSPYGFDDIDLSIRIHKLMPGLIWGAYPIDVTDRGMAHSIKDAGVVAPTTHRDYLVHKWNWSPGLPFDAYIDHPFGNPDNHINFWPTRNDAHWDQPNPGWWRS